MDDKVQYVSLAELENDTDELPGFRPNVDANEFAPPLPHALYLVDIRFEAEDANKRWVPDVSTKGEPKKFNKTNLIITTAGNEDDAVNGRETKHYCSTLVRRGGTTGVQAVLQGIGATVEEIDVNKTRGGQCMLLNGYIDSGKGQAEAEFDWEASHFDADWVNEDTGEKEGKEYFRLRGMERFPIAAEGEAEFDKSIPHVEKEGVRYYPWVDLDITGINNDPSEVFVVLPSEPSVPGRNVQRCFVRNVLRRFKTRTVMGAAASVGVSGGTVAARPAGAPAAASARGPVATPAAAPTRSGPPAGSRPAPTRK